MLGSEILERMRSRRLISISTGSAPTVRSSRLPERTSTRRPSRESSRAEKVGAIRSTTFFSRASRSVAEMLWRTAISAQSGLRPRFSARLRM